MRWWKALGLAGFAGVAATGVVIARSERARRAYTPDEVRAQLHARLTGPPPAAPAGPSDAGPSDAGRNDASPDGTGSSHAGPQYASAGGTGPAHQPPRGTGSGPAARWVPGWRHGQRRPPGHFLRLRPHRR